MATRTVRADPASARFEVLDQTALPHEVRWVPVTTVEQAAHAVRSMQVRGAPLIGVTAAYGLAVACAHDASDAALEAAAGLLAATRPTAVNLAWALRRTTRLLGALPEGERAAAAWRHAASMADEDVATNRAIGEHGWALLAGLAPPPGRPLAVLTHCNAGWLATVDRGTALAPVYLAHEAGVPVHVWVSETRPRNQGLLTAWELAQEGVAHTTVADNATGALLRRGLVDAVVVGADRVAANGDVANKVGTYLKALACADTRVPFYVAAPLSTVDPACPGGDDIPIEERDGDEVRVVRGSDGAARLLAGEAPVANPAFDVTPARLVTAVVTERGVAPATPEGLRGLLEGVDHGQTAAGPGTGRGPGAAR